MKYKHEKTLQEIYNDYLKKHQITGEKPYPDKLLALLLLQEKDTYRTITASSGKFYRDNKQRIDEKINQVINDFDLTKEDIISFIEQKGIYHEEETYERNKVWIVFEKGFGTMHWSIMYHRNYTPEQVYNVCYGLFEGQSKKENTNAKRRTRTLERYKQRGRNGHK